MTYKEVWESLWTPNTKYTRDFNTELDIYKAIVRLKDSIIVDCYDYYKPHDIWRLRAYFNKLPAFGYGWNVVNEPEYIVHQGVVEITFNR